MKPTILVLDDDEPRHEIFRAAAWEFDVVHAYRVSAFALSLQEAKSLALVSLDHDLGRAYADRRCDDCGCDAAELVVRHAPAGVPVLIHSANHACSQVMRRILVAGGHTGRVSRVNIATISEHGERAGVEIIRKAIKELLASPHWPEDLTAEELLDALSDDPDLVCPVRAARTAKTNREKAP